ncbi:DUF881 domain-containing protein [Clostridium sp.]|uniref:DUF881 domain-containing protein n=1 Tax=Clostridium sp. TaxID=1506 RepID=UPI003F3FE6AC
MKDKTGKALAFLASSAIGFLIVNNINLEKLQTSFQLNAVEYQKAIEERNKLYKEIEFTQEENDMLRDKIDSYDDNDDAKQEKLIEDMKNQVKDYGTLIGQSEVKGPGLVIKVNDGDINRKEDTPFETWRKIFHDNDMAFLLNDIRNAGAEAIAVNNHRVLPYTGVECGWAFILFEDESTEAAPFYIYMIGDPEQMKSYLLAEGSYLQNLILRKLNVEIEVKDEIVIPSTLQNTDVKFMQRYEGEQ